jgi:autotransporter-associated beta strand protein
VKPRILATARLSLALASAIAAMLAPQAAHAQTIRTWNGASGTNGWTNTANWSPSGTFAGNAPNVVVTGEGATTDIMAVATANTVGSVVINMGAAGGLGGLLSLGGIDFNRTSTNFSINNSSTTVAGILQLNGASINSVDKTLIRVAGGANLTITNGTGAGTMGLRLGITDGIFDVDSGRVFQITSIISELTVSSGFTKTGSGRLILQGSNTFSGGVTIQNGTVDSQTASTTTLGSGTVTMGGTGSSGARYQTGPSNSNAFLIKTPDSGSITIAGNSAIAVFAMSGPITLEGNLTLETYSNAVAAVTKCSATFTGGITGTGNVLLNNLGADDNTITINTGAINHTGSLTLQGGGTGDTTIDSVIGPNVTSVTQSSAKSRLVLTGNNTFAGGSTLGTTTVPNAGSVAIGHDSALGTGAIILKGALISASGGDRVLANAVNVDAGGFRFGGTNNLTINGLLTTVDALRAIDNQTGDKTLTLAGGINNTFGVQFEGNPGDVANGSIVVSGAISGVGSVSTFADFQNGVLTLSGANDYTGPTTVNAGILAVNGSAIPNAGKLDIVGGKVSIPAATNEVVDTLFYNGVQQLAGVYGSTTSGAGAANQNDTYFDVAGSGTLTVTSGPTFASWLTANAPATGFDTDSDNDGVPNGVENVLGTNPNTFSTGLTQVSANANSVTFKHSLNSTIPSDVSYSYEWSSDLAEWKASGVANTAGTVGTIVPSAPVSNEVTVTSTQSGTPATRLFTRIRATNP